MIGLPSNTRVWIVAGHTDMRKGFDGLAAVAQTALAANPFCGHVFVFRGRRGDILKVLWFDGQGLMLLSKRLERGRFIWPQATMPEALGAVFPATTLQTCIVHLIRNSLDYASWKDRKLLAAAIKPIYTAASAEAALAELDAFEQGAWGRKFPTVVAAWRRAWDRVIPFFAFPPAVRRVIYTTNAIESINARLRKIIKSRGHFPTDDAASKLIWLALRNITADWGRAAHNWKEAMNQFAILYADRFTPAARSMG